MIDLRPVQPGDEAEIFEAWGRHPENFTYLTARTFTGIDDAKRYIANLCPTPESQAFHIVGVDGSIVGIVKAAVVEHRAQIGYVVHRPFWGRGIATAAVRRVTDLVEALPRISRIWATCALENPASARVLEKCGFQREGILRNWVTYPAQGDRAFDNYSYVRIPRGVRRA
jgi:RimJ/RimL family protein N-acetyltransferase